MKLLQVYNDYRSAFGGEAGVVQMIAATVEKHGGQARLLTRSSKGLDQSLTGKIRGFFSGIYNREACREMAQTLRDDRPDVVHVHNLYPLISPSVLVACRRAGVPVVMTNHNYVLTCPVVNHLHKGRVCEKCLGGREYWCVLQNCRDSRAESLAYAVRSITARKLQLFRGDVTIHIMLSDFAKQRLMKEGFDEQRIVVLPNMVELSFQVDARSQGDYAAFSGRMMPEKGVDVLLNAASRLPDVPVRLAGNGPILDKLMAAAPANAMFVNRLDPQRMAAFYRNARFLVVPSKWFEGCPLVVSEAMSHGLPVIASRIGGLPEFVEDGVTGLLFEPGNAAELAEKIRLLWENPDLCRQMGEAGRKKASREYNEEVYYQRLMSIYDRAIEFNRAADTESGVTTTIDTAVKWPPKHGLFGVQVSAVTCAEACDAILHAAHRRLPAVVSAFSAHALVEASSAPRLRSHANRFALITPDGQPVRWALNWLHGAQLRHNVRGSELMWRLCERAADQGVSIYLYGGSPATLAALSRICRLRFPCSGSPAPSRHRFAHCRPRKTPRWCSVNASGAGLMFVGLGCPRQDYFAAEHVERIRAIQLCVGAAFDFHAGTKATAPEWMQRRGLEWLFRLYQEPGRLWKRYLVTNTIFIGKLLNQWIRQRVLGVETGAAADQPSGDIDHAATDRSAPHVRIDTAPHRVATTNHSGSEV